MFRGQWASCAVLSKAISAHGPVLAKAALSGGGMLRVAEPREARVEAGGRSPWAAPPTQSKRLTSFLIQDILRDCAERRGGHAGSPQHQRDSRRESAPEPYEAGGCGVAPEDPPSIRRSHTESPTEPESGKRSRPSGHHAKERTTLGLMALSSGCRNPGHGGGGMTTERTSRSSARSQPP